MALSMAHQELLKEDEYWRRVGELETAVGSHDLGTPA